MLGENMEVQKLVPVLFLVGATACAPKKSIEDVASYKYNQVDVNCSTKNLIKTQFVVRYEDGRTELIESENEQVFEKEFLEPRLQEVKLVEYNAQLQLLDSETEVRSMGSEVIDQGPSLIRADVAWNQGIYGQDVIVAVTDTAVDFTHPQLKTQLAMNTLEANGTEGVDDDNNGLTDDVFGWDFIKDSPPALITEALVEHGSHVAGIIAADPTQGSISGVAPKAKIIAASFIDPSDTTNNPINGSIMAAIRAIKYSASRGAKVINASWGGGSCSDILKETIANLNEQNILFVAASGNESIDLDVYPKASYPAVYNLPNQITVAATDLFDKFVGFSNRSFSLVHIGAPGFEVKSTVPQASSLTGYANQSGTSMAAPFVSGAAALLWSAKPNATVTQIKQALLSSTDYRAYKVSTQGRLNVEKALTEIRRIVP